MGLFLGTSWRAAGSGVGLLLILLYMVVFAVVCETLRAKGHPLQAGLLAASFVALLPLAVFASQKTFHLWSGRGLGSYGDVMDYLGSQWVVMELATLAGSAVAWRRYRTPFLLLPAVVAAWCAVMDGASIWTSRFGSALISAALSAVLLGWGVWLDRRGEPGQWVATFFNVLYSALCG